MQHQHSLLKLHPFFSALGNTLLKAAISKAAFIEVKKARYNNWYNHNHIYFLLEGSVTVHERNGMAEPPLLTLLNAPGIFGNVYLVQGGTSESAEVFSPAAAICYYNKNEFEQLLVNIPALAAIFIQLLHSNNTQVKNKYLGIAYYTAEERVQHCLFNWIKKNGKYINGAIVASNFLSQSFFAQLANCSRQQTNKILNDLRYKGAIKYNQHNISLIVEHAAWKQYH